MKTIFVGFNVNLIDSIIYIKMTLNIIIPNKKIRLFKLKGANDINKETNEIYVNKETSKNSCDWI